MKSPKGRTLLLFAALTGLGLAGNYFRFPVFFSIDFLFGSIFSMLVLQMLGARLGVASAIVASSLTYLLWNHPYAIVIFTTEAIVVAWLISRRRVGFVNADAIYWCCVGMPLVFLFYYFVMQLPLTNATITMLKQAVNGVANALIARFLFFALNYRQRQAQFAMREMIFNFLFLFVLIPSLAFIGIQSRQERDELDMRIRQSLQLTGQKTAANLDTWIHGHMRRIAYLAQLAANRPPSYIQRAVEQLKEEEADFLRVGLLDRNATIVAYSELVDELGQPNIGKNFADRPFIPQLKQTLAPMLSEVIMGRVGKPQPIVPVLAPVVSAGAYAGYVTGVLNLASVENLLALNAQAAVSSRLDYALLDKHDRVIVTNNAALRTMQPFARNKGEMIQLAEGLAQWLPETKKQISISERWKDAVYVHETKIGNRSEWKLILDLPVQPFQQKMYAEYAWMLFRLAVVLALGLLLAGLLSRKIVTSLEQLKLVTANLPNRLSAKEGIDWGQSAIHEIQLLIDNFKSMGQALARKFEEVEGFNAFLEDEVGKRTKDLGAESLRLQTILETASDGIHILDEDGNLVQYSQSFLRMLGYDKKEAAGLNVANWDAQIFPDELVQTVRALIRNPDTFETRHRRKDGTILDVEINAKGVMLDGKAFLYASARDITERKREEAALIAARQAADAANRAKSEFLANMSHEIRTPLNGVIGNAQLLEMSDLSREQKEYLSAIMLSGSNLLSLINDILDLSKIEAEKITLELSDFSLRGCFNNVIRTQRSRIANKGLSLKLQIPNEVPDALVGDELRVKQILLNLLGNAIKFTNAGSITLSAAIEEQKSGKALIEFAVTDTGIGIAKAVADDIFKPFVQADSSITRQYGGSGLGLTISRKLAELMGGSISVESTEGAGSIFRVRLPFTVVHQVVQEHVAPTAAPVALWSGAPLKVLLAEDNEINQQFSAAVLKKMGHQVTLAENGRQALAAVDAVPFDLVLMDIQMPVMDGERALAVLREREASTGAHLPVIALTAYALKGDEEKFLATGFDGYVSKPLEVRKLVAEMKRVLQLERADDKALNGTPPLRKDQQ